ncbi:WD40 repeat protein [Streptomyces aurantiacus]|uniref:P-loop NTPase fold protein n=1 Tax=Streptomyces aurantiacus TaxID=47760 RepID=UPI00278ED3EA|nr:P-loop NTPase fold protein [Streptomyces aurantiacus]MDQ0772899.1 WD40 repeat protein [Streptomyces aurantiacus]
MTSDGAPECDLWLPTQLGGIYALTSWQDPEGRTYLASGGSSGDIRIWDAESNDLLREPLIGHTAAVRKLASWTDDSGTLLYSSGSDGLICVWNPEIGEQIDAFPAQHSGGVMSMTLWSDSGVLQLATGSYDGSVHVWDLHQKSVMWIPRSETGPSVISLAWAENARGRKYLAAGTDAGTITVWDTEAKLQVTPILQGHTAPTECLAWVENGGDLTLLSGGEDGVIKQWDSPDFQKIDWGTESDSSPFWSLCSLPDFHGRKMLASGNTKGEIEIWDVGMRARLQVIRSGFRPISALQYWKTPESDVLIGSAGTDGFIRIWNAADGSLMREINSEHVAAVWALAAWQESDEDSRLASAGLDGIVRVWNPDTGTLVSASQIRHGPGVWALTSEQVAEGHRLLSGSLNGTIRVWNPADCTPVSEELPIHTASVSAMTCWPDSDGQLRVASVGDDSAFRLLSTPGSGVDVKRIVHNGGLLAVTHWVDFEGRRRVASAGTDHTIRIWDGESGEPVGAPIETGTQGIWSLCSWIHQEEGPRVAAGSFDGLVTVWDPVAGIRIGDPFQAEDSAIRGLTCWTNGDDRVRIASGGARGIHVWDVASMEAVGRPLVGHTSGIRTMVSWCRADGSVRLASGGDDGTIRLWDPEEGLSLRTVEVGAISIWGVSDAPAGIDLLNRATLASVIVSQIKSSERTASSSGDGHGVGEELTGPAVITLEGPWGSGKSSLMNLVRNALETQPDGHLNRSERTTERLTVREVMKLLRSNPGSEGDGDREARVPQYPRKYAAAWFNPWAHQSGEQVWAGLAHTIIESAAPVLYPTDAYRERYWLRLNLKRVDNYRVLFALRRSIASPLLGASLLAVALPLAIALLQFNGSVSLLGEKINSPVLAFTLPLIFLVAGIVHTGVRYWRGWAVTFMPDAIFRGPIQAMSGHEAAGGLSVSAEAPADPLIQADRGSLYLRQHDVMRVLSDITKSGYELVVFIDDLDRCQAATTAEVIEAVNIFLSGLAGSHIQVRFVVGMDPYVIATHMDQLYGDPENPGSGSLADDPSIGWAFLRKLSQLPVPIPYIDDQGLDRFIDAATGLAPVSTPASVPIATASGTSLRQPHRNNSARVAPLPARPRQAAGREYGTASAPPVDVIVWRTIEQHPRIRTLLKQRLAEQPDRSIRDAKRLINVWQLYVRLTAHMHADPTEQDRIELGCRLVILAEIVTRWPALHCALHRRSTGRSGLQHLAAAVGSDQEWSEAARLCGMDTGQQEQALANLRALLTRYDGREVAETALLVL